MCLNIFDHFSTTIINQKDFFPIAYGLQFSSQQGCQAIKYETIQKPF